MFCGYIFSVATIYHSLDAYGAFGIPKIVKVKNHTYQRRKMIFKKKRKNNKNNNNNSDAKINIGCPKVKKKTSVLLLTPWTHQNPGPIAGHFGRAALGARQGTLPPSGPTAQYARLRCEPRPKVPRENVKSMGNGGETCKNDVSLKHSECFTSFWMVKSPTLYQRWQWKTKLLKPGPSSH